MNKISSIINNLKVYKLSNEEFEDILDEELLNMENFLDSYTIKKVDEKNLDFTINEIKNYMQKIKLNK